MLFLGKTARLRFSKRVLEEVVPFVAFWRNYRKAISQASDAGRGSRSSRYEELPEESLKQRLDEEHERGRLVDEKTLKFTLALSLALTVVGSASAFLVQVVAPRALQISTVVLAALCVCYALAGGLIALGALKTAPTYGYGTEYAIESRGRKDVIVNALAGEEKVNIARHLRNEAAYQCLRNAVILLALVIVFAFVRTAYAGGQQSDPEGNSEVRPSAITSTEIAEGRSNLIWHWCLAVGDSPWSASVAVSARNLGRPGRAGAGSDRTSDRLMTNW